MAPYSNHYSIITVIITAERGITVGSTLPPTQLQVIISFFHFFFFLFPLLHSLCPPPYFNYCSAEHCTFNSSLGDHIFLSPCFFWLYFLAISAIAIGTHSTRYSTQRPASSTPSFQMKIFLFLCIIQNDSQNTALDMQLNAQLPDENILYIHIYILYIFILLLFPPPLFLLFS